MMLRPLALALLVSSTLPAVAALQAVATTSSMGMLVRTIGGDPVKVTVLAPPDRDAHSLQAKPTMMVALRNADLLVSVGAELEVAWLPAALQGANNGKVLPGTSGYFEGAAQLDLIEKGQAADRAQGDVHPMGNPHYYLDPTRMVKVGIALAGRLSALDPANASGYKARAAEFEKAVAARVPKWKQSAAGAPGAIFFHKDANYLASLLAIQILGFVEPFPGIPPTAAHLKDLVSKYQGKKGVILFSDYQSSQGPDFLARNLNWPKVRLPNEPPLNSSAEDYLKLIDRWVEGIASAK